MSKKKVDLIRMEIIDENNNGVCEAFRNKFLFIKKWIYYVIYLAYSWISKFYNKKNKSEVLIYKSYIYGQLLSVISAGVWWGFFGTLVTLSMNSEIASGVSRLIFNLMFIIMSPISGTLTLIFGMRNILIYSNTIRMFIWCTFCPMLYYIGNIYKYNKISDIIGTALFYILVGFDGILVSLININDLDCGGLNIISYENKFDITNMQKSQIIYTYLNLFDLTFIILNPLISISIFFIVNWYYNYTFNRGTLDNKKFNSNGTEIALLVVLTLFQIFTLLSIAFYRFGIPYKKKNSFDSSTFNDLDNDLTEFEIDLNNNNNEAYVDYEGNSNNFRSVKLSNCFKNNEYNRGNNNEGDHEEDYYQDEDYYIISDNANYDDQDNSNNDLNFISNNKEVLNYNLSEKRKFIKIDKRLRLRDKITFTLIKYKILSLIQSINEVKASRDQVFRAISLGLETGMEDAMMACIIPLFSIHLSKKITIFDKFIIDDKTASSYNYLLSQCDKKVYLISLSLLIVAFVFSMGKLSNLIVKFIYKKELIINHKFNVITGKRNINIDNKNKNIDFNLNSELNNSSDEYDNSKNNDSNYENDFGIDKYLLIQTSNNIVNPSEINYFNKYDESYHGNLNEPIIKKIKILFIYTLIADLSVIILPITLTFFNYFTSSNNNNTVQIIGEFNLII
ncbi:hypothetical protein FG386_001062 [Cryptosporidium ryanae]|uniref:uncharacterized protein n=1 Tax=Cryptosporidium ryanae TaxID=515981 RepID=UPI00351A8F0A|nr:hypothetical protein FG386_001062 [Cryptosporidium ryanae]